MDGQDIVLRAPGSLSGVVSDGVDPIENVYVTVEDDSRALIGDDYTDQYGNYSIIDIYDNDYTIAYTHDDYNSIILTGQHINDGQDLVLDQAMTLGGYAYLPGDANMAAGGWQPAVIGADVTYLVNYFRATAEPCLMNGFYCSADVNGDCIVIGSDVTYLVNYFRGQNLILNCEDYPPVWQTPEDLPVDSPTGWPNCDMPLLNSSLQTTTLNAPNKTGEKSINTNSNTRKNEVELNIDK